MYKIQKQLKEYIETKSAREFRKETGVGISAIYSIIKGHKNKKYTKQVLDSIYDFFGLEKDIFYKNYLKINSGQEDPLGLLFKKRRKELGLEIHDVAKIIKGSDRHLRRIEAGDSTFRKNSYYVKELIKLYNFSKEETNQIMLYIRSLSKIINLSKQRDVLE